VKRLRLVTGAPALAMAGAFLVALLVRSAPGLGDDAWFVHDAAFHGRMTLAAGDGRLHEVDRLRYFPEGARVEELEPTGLYWLGSAADRLFTPLTGSTTSSLRLFVVLCGALVTLPVFSLARTVWGSTLAATLSAFAIAVDPGHVMRTVASSYRFDAPGILLLATHGAFLARALSTEGRKARAHAIGAFAALLALFLVWRVGIGAFALEAVVLACLLVRTRRAELPLLAIGSACLLAVVAPYIRSQHVLLSRAVAPALALSCLAPVVIPRARAARVRVLLLAALLAGAWIARLALPETPFDAHEGSSARAILALHGLGEEDPFLVMLYGTTQELAASPFPLAPGGPFSWLGPVALLALAAVLVRGWRTRRGPNAAGWFVLGCGLGWILATAFVARAAGLASPAIAVACGGLAAGARTRSARTAATLLGAIAFILAGRASLRLVRDYPVDASPPARAVCRYLSERVPVGSPILCDWGLGYLFQTHAHRPTITDGHLEHPLNRERILRVSRAFAAHEPEPLLALCRELGIETLVLDETSTGLPFLYTGLAGRMTRSGQVELPSEVLQSVIVRLLQATDGVPGVREVFRAEPYHVFALTH